jgi:nitrate/TMAO reductase-like tetraheme cytochrome c subunit
MALLWRLCKRGHPLDHANSKWVRHSNGVEHQQCRICHNTARTESLKRKPEPRYILRTDWSMNR